MPTWGWVVLAAGAAVIVALAAWMLMQRRRTKALQGQFGPEYDRTLGEADSKREAEAELAARKARREQLEIRPLSSAAADRYRTQWQSVQAQFVDSPAAAVAAADQLIQSVMAERGYPVDDFESRTADVSVDHPHVVENYREGHRLATASSQGKGSTEDLRQAMRHYRALFQELVETAADEPMTRGRDEDVAADAVVQGQNGRAAR